MVVKRFEKGEALHKGRWLPVTTFLVVTEYGSEWCCLDGWHSRASKEVEKEIEVSVELLKQEAVTECPCMGTVEDCWRCSSSPVYDEEEQSDWGPIAEPDPGEDGDVPF